MSLLARKLRHVAADVIEDAIHKQAVQRTGLFSLRFSIIKHEETLEKNLPMLAHRKSPKQDQAQLTDSARAFFSPALFGTVDQFRDARDVCARLTRQSHSGFAAAEICDGRPVQTFVCGVPEVERVQCGGIPSSENGGVEWH